MGRLKEERCNNVLITTIMKYYKNYEQKCKLDGKTFFHDTLPANENIVLY